MAYLYTLHELAHEKYIAAYEWYEQRQKGLGDKFAECVEKNYIRSVSILNIM